MTAAVKRDRVRPEDRAAGRTTPGTKVHPRADVLHREHVDLTRALSALVTMIARAR